MIREQTDATAEWGAELDEARLAVEDALSAIDEALKKTPSARLLQVRSDVERARSAVSQAWDRYVEAPMQKLLDGRRLSREEFYMMIAAGVMEGTAKQFTGAPFDDFELFDLLCYDDGRKRCYVNPELQPGEDRHVKLRSGAPPEELDWDGLRPEQKTFFDRYDPELARRFRR